MRTPTWTRDRIEALRQWADEGGDMRVASYKQWTRGRDAPADVTVARVFGSWREAVRAAGFAPSDDPGYDGAYRRG